MTSRTAEGAQVLIRVIGLPVYLFGVGLLAFDYFWLGYYLLCWGVGGMMAPVRVWRLLKWVVESEAPRA